MAKIVYVKSSRGSDIYEIGDYEIRIPEKVQYSFRTNQNEPYTEEEGVMLSHKTITIKNKLTEAKTTKRCYQSDDILVEELEADFNTNQKQFKWV
ncbi:hypothetical protein [Bacillus andreraoultii]|uniref:hypothetical protein n=1 Tax=Bacillus andreraoultii TaxID=1499685 RepID=UPI00053AA5E1|nr:hypothetical protein [Bacillus andreraoultii]